MEPNTSKTEHAPEKSHEKDKIGFSIALKEKNPQIKGPQKHTREELKSRRLKMVLSRRNALKVGASLGAAALFDSRSLFGQQQLPLLTKAIPSNGERIPVVGLGSAGTTTPPGDQPVNTSIHDPVQTVYSDYDHFYDYTYYDWGDAETTSTLSTD